jgi:UDP-glucose 4-epimerase
MKALVTGGAGFIGSTVVDLLIAHGHEVLAVDDLSTGSLANLSEARREGGIRFHRFDVRSGAVRDLIANAKPDVVLHLAAQPSVPASVADPVRDAEVNMIGLINVLEACVAASVPKVVFAASGGTIYGVQQEFPVREDAPQGPLTSPYGISKRAAEHYLRYYQAQHGLDFMSLALANVYGPRQDPNGESGVVAIFAEKVLSGVAPTIHGEGNDTRDYVFVDDVAHAFVLASERGSGETVNIGTGIETTTNDLFGIVAEAAGSTVDAVHGPPRAGDVPRSALDPSKAAEVIGWTPWTSVADGLRRTVRWFAARRR